MSGAINILYIFFLLISLVECDYRQFFYDNLNRYNQSLVSNECKHQLLLHMEGLLRFERWAWQMFDASTKVPTGLLDGDFYDLGNFDECLNIATETVQGKYCLGTIPISFDVFKKNQLSKDGHLRMLGNDPKFSGLHFAVCIPHKCTAQDITNIYPLQTFDEKYCYSRETKPQWTWGAVTAVAILGVFLLIVVLSTSYDIFLHYTGIKPGLELTIAFSYLTNGRKLIRSSENSDQLLLLNGIRSLSLIWIVIFHEYVNGASGAVANYIELSEFPKDTSYMFVIGATVAVDTFFVIGGLVTVYTYLKSKEKGVKFNLPLYYIHRYIRLTPALAIVILVHATLLKHLGDGPLWNSFDDHLVQACRKHWWAALLYIQNYVHDEQVCVPQSWYLSIDMQLFILSPFVLLPLKKRPKLVLIILIILTLVGIIVSFFVAFSNELRAFLFVDKENVQRYIFFYYEQTYCRFGAYVIGMVLGYYVYKLKQGKLRLKLNWLSVLSLWVVCLSGLLACVYAGHDIMLSEYNKWSHSLYIAFNRTAWSLAISGVIFICIAGYGGPVNAFLSSPIFQFLSKISYSIYLVHYELILVRTASFRTQIRISHFLMAFNFWGDFMFSLALAVILYLTFEIPMITMEKLLLEMIERARTKPKIII